MLIKHTNIIGMYFLPEMNIYKNIRQCWPETKHFHFKYFSLNSLALNEEGLITLELF